jgi:hypothetical protein
VRAAHTPGPWILTKTEHETTISDWHIQIGDGRLGLFPYKRIYSEDRKQSGLVTDDELMSNARLIAAAPDLLDALQRLYKELPYINQINGGMQAKEAIAKATGATT